MEMLFAYRCSSALPINPFLAKLIYLIFQPLEHHYYHIKRFRLNILV